MLRFDDKAILIIADAFAEVMKQHTCYGCAIMWDHVHVQIRKHRDRAEAMIRNLQDPSRSALIEAGRRPATHPVWGGPSWKVYLDTREAMYRAERYIAENPEKAHRPAQTWPFVQPCDGWLPNAGGPYRRR